MPKMTDLNHVKDLLRAANQRVVITDVEPVPGSNTTDISVETAESFRLQAEADIEARLSRFYNTPLELTNRTTINLIRQVATRKTAYAIYLALRPMLTAENIPIAVQKWDDEAESTLRRIVPEGKDSPVAGRDIILEGESTKFDAGSVGGTSVAFTTTLPFGRADS